MAQYYVEIARDDGTYDRDQRRPMTRLAAFARSDELAKAGFSGQIVTETGYVSRQWVAVDDLASLRRMVDSFDRPMGIGGAAVTLPAEAASGPAEFDAWPPVAVARDATVSDVTCGGRFGCD